MTYSRNKSALKRVQKLLDDLLLAVNNKSDDDVVFTSTNPNKLSYQLHEALDVADTFTEYTKYRVIKEHYRIRVRFDRVIAECKTKPVDAKAILSGQLSKMTVDDADTVLEVIGAAIKNNLNEMYFPNAELIDSELADLYKWTSVNGYYIINNYEVGITLTRVNPGELAYEPTRLSTDKG